MPRFVKIQALADLAKTIERLKKRGKKIVHCHGCFDLMHPGHIMHFEAAKKLGDVLVVTVTPDNFVNKGPGRPVYNQQLRVESIASLAAVDFVALNEWPDAVETIKLLKPNLFVKDREFEEAKDDPDTAVYRERCAVEAVGGKLHLTGEVRFSSTRLLNDFFGVYSETAESFLKEFRKKYSAEALIQKLKELKDVRALVIGDTIIDEYHYVKPMGKTPKSNTIAAHFLSEENFAGGILASANHIAGFCGHVHLVTCLGSKNDRVEFIQSHLKTNVTPRFFFRSDTTTVAKRRFVDPSFMGKLFELYFYDDHPLPKNVEEDIYAYLCHILPTYDLVVVNDFGHGFLNSRLVEALCEKSRFLAVNTQANTGNYGFNVITKYPRADYICLDEPEARLACRSKFDDLKIIQSEISKKLNCGKIMVTRGHLGTLAYSRADNGEDCSEHFWEVPVFANKIVDTVGAGDAFFSVTSPCAAMNWPVDLLAFIGNAVGALAVGIVGNRSSVEPEQLFQFITTLLK